MQAPPLPGLGHSPLGCVDTGFEHGRQVRRTTGTALASLLQPAVAMVSSSIASMPTVRFLRPSNVTCLASLDMMIASFEPRAERDRRLHRVTF